MYGFHMNLMLMYINDSKNKHFDTRLIITDEKYILTVSIILSSCNIPILPLQRI